MKQGNYDMDHLLSTFPGLTDANCQEIMPWARKRIHSLVQEEGIACCGGQAKLQAAKGRSWAGGNPSGDPGGGLSTDQLCGLAGQSAGPAIGDEDVALSMVRVPTPYVEEEMGACVLKACEVWW